VLQCVARKSNVTALRYCRASNKRSFMALNDHLEPYHVAVLQCIAVCVAAQCCSVLQCVLQHMTHVLSHCAEPYHVSRMTSCVNGRVISDQLDWFEVDLGFTETYHLSRMTSWVKPKSTSNQSSKPCTVLQYPSKKVRCDSPGNPAVVYHNDQIGGATQVQHTWVQHALSGMLHLHYTCVLHLCVAPVCCTWVAPMCCTSIAPVLHLCDASVLHLCCACVVVCRGVSCATVYVHYVHDVYHV